MDLEFKSTDAGFKSVNAMYDRIELKADCLRVLAQGDCRPSPHHPKSSYSARQRISVWIIWQVEHVGNCRTTKYIHKVPKTSSTLHLSKGQNEHLCQWSYNHHRQHESSNWRLQAARLGQPHVDSKLTTHYMRLNALEIQSAVLKVNKTKLSPCCRASSSDLVRSDTGILSDRSWWRMRVLCQMRAQFQIAIMTLYCFLLLCRAKKAFDRMQYL